MVVFESDVIRAAIIGFLSIVNFVTESKTLFLRKFEVSFEES